MVIPYVSLNALAIHWRRAHGDARAATMSLGLGLALASLMQLLLSGFDVRLLVFAEVLRAVAPLLLAVFVPMAISLLLAVGDRRHRLPMYAVASALLLTLNLSADRTLLLTRAFSAYETAAVILAAGLLGWTLRRLGGGQAGNPPAAGVGGRA